MNREIGILFMMVTIGGVVSCIFDFFRAIRMIFKPNTAVVAISDIIFCTVGMYVITACLFKYNNGILRFYHVAGLAIGSVIYFSSVSKWFLKVFIIIIENILKIIKLILKILLTPLGFLYKILVVPVKKHIKGQRRKD